jgi:exodeoxyribonuclease VII small subunit
MAEVAELNFEQTFMELEGVVRQLEAGDLPLDEAMALFERGVALAGQCNAKLDAAELRVHQLVPGAAQGRAGKEYDLSPFEEQIPSDDPR